MPWSERLQQGEFGTKPIPLAAPAECFHTSLLFCPTAFTCHMLFRKSVPPKDVPKTCGIILLELLQIPKLSWIHKCRSLRQ